MKSVRLPRSISGHGPLRRAAVAAVAMLSMVSLAACSATGGRPRDTGGDGSGGGGVDTPRYTVAMVSHGAPGDTRAQEVSAA